MDETSTEVVSTQTASRIRPGSVSPEDVTWRELRRGFWAGRSDGRPIGVIEQGRRYTFTGVDEQVHLGFRTLADAQEAATGPISIPSASASGVPGEPEPGRASAAARRRLIIRIAAVPAL